MKKVEINMKPYCALQNTSNHIPRVDLAAM